MSARGLILCLVLLAGGHVGRASGETMEAPRIIALLEQGQAAEAGILGRKYPRMALALYCEAGRMGSPIGFFHVGRLLRETTNALRNPQLGNSYLALASRLGHHRAQSLHDPAIEHVPLLKECDEFSRMLSEEEFDMKSYLDALPAGKRKIAEMIRHQAPRYGVDTRFVLAVAMAESNFNPRAVSPKNAQGVMQLIPDTQERFGVKRPFDPARSIRGGLSYLRWLFARFGGDFSLVAAAYNAGEGVVERYGGIPPFPETQQYVRRVLFFAGLPHPDGG